MRMRIGRRWAMGTSLPLKFKHDYNRRQPISRWKARGECVRPMWVISNGRHVGVYDVLHLVNSNPTVVVLTRTVCVKNYSHFVKAQSDGMS